MTDENTDGTTDISDYAGPAEWMGLPGQVPVVFKLWAFLQALRVKKNFENRTIID